MVDADEIRVPVKADTQDFDRKMEGVERKVKDQKRQAEGGEGGSTFKAAALGGAVGGFLGGIVGDAASLTLGPLIELMVNVVVAFIYQILMPLMPAIKSGIEWLVNTLGPALSKAIEWLTSTLGPVLTSMGQTLHSVAAALGIGPKTPADEARASTAMSGAAVGALGGAAIGFMVGGPPGALVGAGIGGAAGFFGTPPLAEAVMHQTFEQALRTDGSPKTADPAFQTAPGVLNAQDINAIMAGGS